MRIIVFEAEVAVLEVKNIFFVGIDYHLRQRTWLACELETCLLEVIEIKMCVAEGVDEFSRLEAGALSHHHKQESIRRNVERHAEEAVGGALIELERQAPVGDVELKQRMARRQFHVVDVGHIPGAHDYAA